MPTYFPGCAVCRDANCLCEVGGLTATVYQAQRRRLRINSRFAYDEFQLDLERRCSNKTFLPSEIHLTAVDLPESLYFLFGEDKAEQLYRRLSGIVYHWRDEDGNRREYILENPDCSNSGAFYKGKQALIDEALADGGTIVPYSDYGYGEARYSNIY